MFNIFICLNSKKGVSPVVATALLLVVAVVSVVGFQGWFNEFSSSVLSDIESDTSSGNSVVVVEDIIGNVLYLNSKGSSEILSVEVEGVDCNVLVSEINGISKLDIRSCVESVESTSVNVVVLTSSGIVDSFVTIENKGSYIDVYSDEFISVWNTSIIGSSPSNQISLPLTSIGSYNFFVDWGDGSNDTINNYLNNNHTYSVPGIYTVTISGEMNGFMFNNTGDKNKIIDVSNWGNLKIGNSGHYFYGCSNLEISAKDAPVLSGVTVMTYMFADNIKLNSNFNHWDVSKVQSFSGMFLNTSVYNQPLNKWDTTSAITFNNMFSIADSFNQPLNDWDTSSVENIGWMFNKARDFNQPLSNWDTSSVSYMRGTFSNADSFNQPLNSWNTGLVDNMGFMFASTDVFNQPLDNWDTSSVTRIDWMFNGVQVFDQDLNEWDTSSITNMDRAFYGSYVFNGNISSWSTSIVTTMYRLFRNSPFFNQNISSWDVSSVGVYTQFDDGSTAWVCGNKPAAFTGGCP